MRSAIVLLLAAGSAVAQNNRSFVATSGSDANNCSQGNACRSFARAITQTNAGGEIIAINSGGFGTFTVDKSLIIVAPTGVNAAVTATAGDAIVVNAPGATVVLRGLDVNALGGANGIAATDFSALFIENCQVNGFTQDGINVSTLVAAETYVRGCTIRNNAFGGLSLVGTQKAIVERTSLFSNNDFGLNVVGPEMKVTARACVSTGNDSGFGSSFGELNLQACVSSGNNVGVSVFSNATVRISNCTVTNNAGAGLFNFNNDSAVETRQNNTIAGNSPNILGNVTPISGQ